MAGTGRHAISSNHPDTRCQTIERIVADNVKHLWIALTFLFLFTNVSHAQPPTPTTDWQAVVDELLLTEVPSVEVFEITVENIVLDNVTDRTLLLNAGYSHTNVQGFTLFDTTLRLSIEMYSIELWLFGYDIINFFMMGVTMALLAKMLIW